VLAQLAKVPDERQHCGRQWLHTVHDMAHRNVAKHLLRLVGVDVEAKDGVLEVGDYLLAVLLVGVAGSDNLETSVVVQGLAVHAPVTHDLLDVAYGFC